MSDDKLMQVQVGLVILEALCVAVQVVLYVSFGSPVFLGLAVFCALMFLWCLWCARPV